MNKKILFALVFISLIGLVAGYNGFYGGASFEQVFVNFVSSVVFRFILVFALFFALVYYSSVKFIRMRASAIVVGAVTSLLITSSLYMQGFLQHTSFTEFAVAVGLLIGLVALFRCIYSLSGILASLILFGVWIFLSVFDIFDFLPYGFYTEWLELIVWLLSGWSGLILLGLVLIIVALRHAGMRKALLNSLGHLQTN